MERWREGVACLLAIKNLGKLPAQQFSLLDNGLAVLVHVNIIERHRQVTIEQMLSAAADDSFTESRGNACWPQQPQRP